MFVDIQETQTDTDGVWADYQEGVRFRIARAGNRQFLRAADKIDAPFRKQIARGKLSTEKQIDNLCKAMAEAILLDWEGIATADGDLPYSAESAYAVLRHNPDVRDFVAEFSGQVENYRTETIKKTAKKSQTG